LLYRNNLGNYDAKRKEALPCVLYQRTAEP
jgi:hypothetical protein